VTTECNPVLLGLRTACGLALLAGKRDLTGEGRNRARARENPLAFSEQIMRTTRFYRHLNRGVPDDDTAHPSREILVRRDQKRHD